MEMPVQLDPVSKACVPVALLPVSVPSTVIVALAPMFIVAPGAIVTVTPAAMSTFPSCWPVAHVVSADIVVVAPPLLLEPPELLLLPPLLDEELPELLPEELEPPLLPPPLPPLLPLPPLDPVSPVWWSPEPGMSEPEEQPAASVRLEIAMEAFSDLAWRNMRQTPLGR
jgi:hypothetical protein